jgi:hypothetical protein
MTAKGHELKGSRRAGAVSARSAPRAQETANGEIEADEHHERDNPLIALGRTVRDDKHAAVVDVRRVSPQEGAKFLIARSPRAATAVRRCRLGQTQVRER